MALERAFRAFQGARPNGDAGCFRAAWMHGTNKRTSGNYLLLIQQIFSSVARRHAAVTCILCGLSDAGTAVQGSKGRRREREPHQWFGTGSASNTSTSKANQALWL